MNDDTPRNDNPAGADPTAGGEHVTEPLEGRPRLLRRSGSDRVVTGVAGGLGRYFGVDPVIFRIGFALSLFFGGLGGLAYLLLAIFVPTDGDPDVPQRIGGRLQRAGFWRGLGIAALVVIAAFGLLALAGGAAFAVALGWGVPVGIGIVALGLVLVVAAFGRGLRWLIPPVVALVAGAGVASAADLDFRGGIGEREYHPVAAASIPSGGYRLGVGRLAIDLRDLNWDDARVVRVKVDLGTGQADVFVPARVCVRGTAHVRVGELEVAGEQNDGIDVDHVAGAGATAVPRLEIDGHVDVGQLRVINSDTVDIHDSGYGDAGWDDVEAPLRAAERRACAR
jgi:phage shock protein PspC (stress-responsive transcriptional regulator)